MMLCRKTKFGNKRISSSEDIVGIIQFSQQDTPAYDDVLSSQVWLQFCCMTLWLMMLAHDTRFGIKMVCGSEDIIQTNIH